MTSPLELHLRREMIKFAVQRAIFCPFTQVTLDCRTAVVIETADDKYLGVVSPEAWASMADTVREKIPGVLARTWNNPTGRD